MTILSKANIFFQSKSMPVIGILKAVSILIRAVFMQHEITGSCFPD